jgi:hypothetical protein
MDPWRNGSASDSRSEGYPFKSGGVQKNILEFYFFLNFLNLRKVLLKWLPMNSPCPRCVE